MATPDKTHRSAFPVTRWTLVQAVQGDNPEEAARAMEKLCEGYWYPIYTFLRHSGRGAHDAEDLTQEFFQKLVSEDTLHSAREDAGKLRSYLLAVLKRLLSDDTRHRGALKRGGQLVHVPFDAMEADQRFALEVKTAGDPESHFTRAWAEELISGVREKLRAAYEVTGRAGVFETLLPFLMWDKEPPSHREIATQIGSSEAASRILIHRLRVKFRSLLRDELALTVQTPEEIPGELAWLQDVLSEK